MNRRVVRVPEQRFKDAEAAVFSIEQELPIGHPTRVQLYRVRIELGRATSMNRARKDWAQDTYEYEEVGDLVKEAAEDLLGSLDVGCSHCHYTERDVEKVMFALKAVRGEKE
jgi:hypothetical protein